MTIIRRMLLAGRPRPLRSPDAAAAVLAGVAGPRQRDEPARAGSSDHGLRQGALSHCVGGLLCLVMAGAAAGEKPDVRAPVSLTGEERSWLLGEMRRNVAVLQQMTAALSEGKSSEVGELAATFGSAAAAKDPSRPPQLRQKLPAAWVALAIQLHKDFDGIAEAAASTEAPERTLARMSRLMQNCVACHAAYRLADAP